MRLVILILAVAFTRSVMAAEVDIDVVGLFKGAAMLQINGEQVLMRDGETSSHGITLVSADSREAIIKLDGRQITLNLSSQIGTEYKEAKPTALVIARDDLGQYRTRGSINGRPAAFLIDTGANIVALNSSHAEDLELNYLDGQVTRATTAGGHVKSWAITLGSVQVGDITVTNVRAAVLEGSFPQEILLGMSFLSSVEMQDAADVLTLKSKL